MATAPTTLGVPASWRAGPSSHSTSPRRTRRTAPPPSRCGVARSSQSRRPTRAPASERGVQLVPGERDVVGAERCGGRRRRCGASWAASTTTAGAVLVRRGDDRRQRHQLPRHVAGPGDGDEIDVGTRQRRPRQRRRAPRVTAARRPRSNGAGAGQEVGVVLGVEREHGRSGGQGGGEEVERIRRVPRRARRRRRDGRRRERPMRSRLAASSSVHTTDGNQARGARCSTRAAGRPRLRRPRRGPARSPPGRG